MRNFNVLTWSRPYEALGVADARIRLEVVANTEKQARDICIASLNCQKRECVEFERWIVQEVPTVDLNTDSTSEEE